MRLFLDSSVLLAAAGSPSGGSTAVITLATARRWPLIVNDWVLEEVDKNIDDLGVNAATRWRALRPLLVKVRTLPTLDRIVLFPARKDRPVLFTALNTADVLLTLDRRDFVDRLGGQFYDLIIQTPREFLRPYGQLRS